VVNRVAVALIVVGAAIAACQVVAGIERVEKVTLGAEAGGLPDPCEHTRPPDPPPAGDAGADQPPIVFAFRELRLTSRLGEPAFPGLDLDKSCTCDRRPGVGNTPSCTAKDTICDGDGGIDNFSHVIFKQFEAGDSEIDGDVREDIDQGRRGFLLQISEWNGEANDAEVKVGTLVTSGVSDPSGCGVTTTSDRGVHFHPGWCGRDKWDYPPGTVRPTDGVDYVVSRGLGYVVDNRLVYRANKSINLFFGLGTLSFGSATIYGKLVKPPNGPAKLTDAILTGRIPIEEFLAAAGQFSIKVSDAGTRAPICTRPEFKAIKEVLCQSVDIMRSEVGDYTNAACDAVSAAIGFTAEQAVFGTEREGTFTGNECSPSLPENQAKYQCPP
jgi:hypothetical protein